jgi:hypothetical protein
MRKLHRLRKWLGTRVEWLRFGTITERVVDFAGGGIPCEIEYRGRGGKLVGYWAYGNFDPAFPYRG